ncbi:hypothetical protein [Haliangium sp. UPWRP_2]|uniref:hypothetical protein n=1 Tax=Haliangium sp. UPWRP_2 TaxID=1931276 RepID=UPI000B53FD49|nr:hypothetical protein [Haliangium sp. UPWRP_2]PSM31692.1 hypothetical protein BVG81_004125 [Haliangium sp. UPWRP_2]
MYFLTEAEQREVYKRVVAEPAGTIRDMITDQIKLIDQIPDIRKDPRRDLLQGEINLGDRLADSDKEPDRIERRRQYALAFMLGHAILEESNNDLIDPDMYYRGSSAIGRWIAAGKRFMVAITLSIKYWDDEAIEFASRFLKPDNIWILALITMGVVAAIFWGGWVALVINGVLYAAGVYDLVKRADQGYDDIKEFGRLALEANSDADLDKAARFFAKAITLLILTIFELWVLHKSFGVIRKLFRARYVSPEPLENSFGERLSAERARRKAEADRRRAERDGEDKKSDEKRDDKSDEKRSDEKDSDDSRRKSEGKGDAVKVIGGKRIADEVDDNSGFLWLALLGVVVAVGLGASRRGRG